MTLQQWIILGLGGAALLAGAALLLIGWKKKSLVLWKLVPGLLILCGVVVLGMQGYEAIKDNNLTKRENYVACRLAEMDAHIPAQNVAGSAYSRKPNGISARLMLVSLGLENKTGQAAQTMERYREELDEETVAAFKTLFANADKGMDVRADYLLMLKDLMAEIDLSASDAEKAESIVNVQAGVFNQGGINPADVQRLEEENDPLSLRTIAMASRQTGDKSSHEVYEMLEEAALQDDSFPARAALAQMVASGYADPRSPEADPFSGEEGAIYRDNEKTMEKIGKLQAQLAANTGKREKLEAQLAELQKEIDERQKVLRELPVRRAINFLKTTRPTKTETLAYDYVMSQLYCRLGDEKTAQDYLEKAIVGAIKGDTGYLSGEFENLLAAYDRSVNGDSQNQNSSRPVHMENVPDALRHLQSASGQFMDLSGDFSYTPVMLEGEDSMQGTDKSYADFVLDVLQDVRTGVRIGKVDTTNYPEIAVSVNVSKKKENGKSYDAGDFQLWDQGGEIKDFDLEDGSDKEGESNVCMVVDRSGSMGGNNLKQAQRAVGSFVRSAGDRMNIGLVAFDSEAQILSQVSKSTAGVQRSVDMLRASGGTNISAGLTQGLRALTGKGGSRIIVLLSDGADSSRSQNAIDGVVSQLRAEGIIVYAVGFDSAESSYLNRICNATGGQFLRAQSSEDLGSVYRIIEKYLSQDYVLRFKVDDDTEKEYEREVRVALENGVIDKEDYFVGVSPQRIEEEKTNPPKSDFYQEIGGSGKEEAVR